jgi:hypothetical protein
LRRSLVQFKMSWKLQNSRICIKLLVKNPEKVSRLISLSEISPIVASFVTALASRGLEPDLEYYEPRAFRKHELTKGDLPEVCSRGAEVKSVSSFSCQP